MSAARPALRRLAATLAGATFSITMLVCLPLLTTNDARAALTDLVKVTGTMDNGETENGISSPFLENGLTGTGISMTCQQQREAIFEFVEANPGLSPIIELGRQGLPLMAEILEWGPINEENLAAPCPEVVDGDFQIFYTTCSMTMFMGQQGAPVQMLRWTVPPESPEAGMVVIDGTKGISVKLETAMEQLRAQGNTGTMATTNVDPLQETRTYSLAGREYEAQLYRYNYVGRMSPLLMAQSQDLLTTNSLSLDIIKVENEGWAYVAPDVEGLDVIQTFYDNFERYVAPAAGGGSLFGGMVEQMSALIAHGLPLQGESTSKSGMDLSAASGLTAFPALSATMGLASATMSSTDKYTIKDVRAAPIVGTDLCAPTVIPEGFEVMDLAEAMAGASAQSPAGGESSGFGDLSSGLAGAGAAAAATGGAGGANGEMTPAQIAAMQQGAAGLGALLGGAGAATENMTPEQQAAMQQVSGMFGGLLGGGAAAAGAAAGGTPGAAAAGATAPVRARSGPSLSSALMTDDLTQSAQNMLEALGYDPGNTDGELGVETTIAISQFQAEKGLEVTGEVTPQLVGMLAAEVDSL